MVKNSMRSQDWICPRCRNMQFGQNITCKNCFGPKPTLRTMGAACHAYYPMMDQRIACEGERHCPDCHGIIHQSHSECHACRERRNTVAELQGRDPGQRGGGQLALTGPAKQLALTAGPPRNAVDVLAEQYKGLSPEQVIEEMEILKGVKEKPADPKAALEELERKRRREQEASAARVQAILQGEDLVAERERKRRAASDRIQAMLEADERAAAGGLEEPAPQGDGPAEEQQPQQLSPAVGDAEEEERRKKAAEEERRARRLQLRQQQKLEEEEKKRRQRERRQQVRQASAAAGGGTVVID